MEKKPRGSKIVQLQKQFTADTDAYKQFAENRRNKMRYTQEFLTRMYEDMKDYFAECKQNKARPTIGKLCIALGIDKMALLRMRRGEMDTRLPEYLDMHNVTYDDVKYEEDEFFKGDNPLQYWIDPDTGEYVLLMMYSEITRIGCAYVEAEVEELVLTGNKPVGSIFYLKSVFGYSDEPSQAPVNTDNRIATKEDAEAGIERIFNEEGIRQAILLLNSDKVNKSAPEKLSED